MHAFRAFRSKNVAPLTLAAAGVLVSSSRLERRTAVAEPSVKRGYTSTPQLRTAHSTEKRKDDRSSDAAGNGVRSENKPLQEPIGPMVAVFLDDSSVDKLKGHFPEASDGQLRKVVVQYGPSAAQREMYRHLFNGKAEVTVTGEASSFARRALAASVSHKGRLVEPVSLSAAIDISPTALTDPNAPAADEKDGPGPLASAALIEQVKKAGATKEELWEGTLPPLLAHERQFPSEPGAFIRLKEPITVHGTICRADWVEGASTICRDTMEGGEKRPEDWEPSSCSICAFFSVTPCNGIFNRFLATSKRRDEYLKTFQPQMQGKDDQERGETLPKEGATDSKINGEGSDVASDANATVGTVGQTEATRDSARDGKALVGAQGGGEDGSPADKKHVATPVGNAAEDSRNRQAERDLIEHQLEKEAQEIYNEMKECMIYHDLY